MFGVLHPLLLWGTLAVGIPIAIHLLLRQRPRPRPWAAMRWLQAAMQRAQRRFRLTNLLLLLLRCLIVALIALALARPSWSLLGQGGTLVLIVDQTASMGARGDQAGPLASAAAALATAELPARVRVVAVADRARVVAEGGPDEARAALQRLTALPLPGGLDLLGNPQAGASLLDQLSADADVILVSDFQQDDGTVVAALLAEQVRSVRRWVVGEPTGNTAIIGIERVPDPLPGEADEALLTLLSGGTGPIRLAVNGGPSTEAGQGARFAVPPLEPGDHRLALSIADQGLAYDNRLELPLRVRAPVPVLLAVEHTDYLAASLLADTRHFAPATGDRPQVLPAQLPAEALPTRGLVALRGRSGDGERLARWLHSGGVLWAPLELLRDDPALAPLVAGISVGDPVPTAPFVSGMRDLDEVFATAAPATVIGVTALPENAEVILRAGREPLIVVLPVARGRLVVECTPLSGDAGLTARGATPLWVRRVARRLTAATDAPLWWEAGRPAPANAELRRAGISATAVLGEPLLAEPGAWTDADGRHVIITPNREEARIDRAAPPGAARTVAEALPPRSGADWGLWLLLTALVVLFLEGALAAWAGRQYGR